MHCNIGGLAALVFLMTRTEEIPWYFWEFAYNNYLHSRFLYVLKWIFICGKIGKTSWVSKGENVTLIYIIYFENFVILLSLRFYVKSILGNCRSAKSAILTHLGALKIFLWIFALFEGWNSPNQQNSEPPTNDKKRNFRNSKCFQVDLT